MVKRMRKGPAWASSKYPTLPFMLLDLKPRAYA